MKNILLRFRGINALLLLSLLLVLTSFMLLTERSIEGLVLSDTKEPLPFANVMVEGTTIGTTTDIDGKFTLKIPDVVSSITLIVSYTGYEDKRIEVGDEIL